MDIGFFLSVVYFAIMGFALISVGSKLVSWNSSVSEVIAGAFIFIVGCGFTTMWALGVLKLAMQQYGL